MDNQNNNLQELEELRSQVAEFKNRMEQQEIVSRRLLKEAMKGHVSWIKQMSFWGSVAELVLLPLFVYILRSIAGFLWLPIIVLGLLIAGEAVFNFWNVSTIRDKHLAVDDVLSVQQRLITFKRREKLYTFGILPLLLLWLACIPFGVFHGTNIAFPSDRLVVFFVAIVIVFTLLFYVFSREMRSLNKAIKDIDDFMGKERTE
jgi:4-amino-4-deoxy-L-arabinose transferase-like glycosyltransferase